MITTCETCEHTHTHGSDLDERVRQLTTCELEVFARMATGPSNDELARELFVTERTVRAHLTSIKVKIGAGTRLHVALLADAWNQQNCRERQ